MMWKWKIVHVVGVLIALTVSPQVATGQEESPRSDEATGSASGESAPGDTESEGESAGTSESSAESEATASEADTAAATDTGTEQEENPLGTADFGPGTFDFSASLGISGLLYATIEPGIDIGLIPVSDDVTLSFGANVGLGYCVLCAGGSALFNEFSLSAWHLSPQGRMLFHVNPIGRAMGAPVDMYGGLSAGPNFYFFRVSDGTATLRGNRTTLLVAPLIGGRVFPGGTGAVFIFGEGRYQTEWGFSQVRLESDEWSSDFVWRDAYARRGLDIVIGGGVRF